MKRPKNLPGAPDPKKLAELRARLPRPVSPEILDGVKRTIAKLDKIRARFETDEEFREYMKRRSEREFERLNRFR